MRTDGFEYAPHKLNFTGSLTVAVRKLHPQPRAHGLRPLHKESLAAFAFFPPAVGGEIPIRRSDYVDLHIGRQRSKGPCCPPRMKITGDQVDLVDVQPP